MNNVIPLFSPGERFVDKRQLATHFGFSIRWVEARMTEGMPFHRFGNRVRFRISETETWLSGRAA